MRRRDRTTRKRIEAIKERLSERLESIKDRRDDMVTIEEIGIDQIVVDEARSSASSPSPRTAPT